MISQTLVKHFDCVRVSNADSMREGGWSSVPEITEHKEFVNLKTVSVATLNQLVKMKYVEKKADLYRVTNAGILFFETQGQGGEGPGPYKPPDYPPGQDGYPPGQDGTPPPDGDQYTRGGGAPAGGTGIAVPVPVSGLGESVIKNLM